LSRLTKVGRLQARSAWRNGFKFQLEIKKPPAPRKGALISAGQNEVEVEVEVDLKAAAPGQGATINRRAARPKKIKTSTTR